MFDVLVRDFTQAGIANASEQAARLLEGLDRAGTIDLATGAIKVNEQEVRLTLAEFFPPDVIEQHVKAIDELQWQGAVSIKDPSGQAAAIPLAVLPALAEGGFIPQSSLDNLGVKTDVDPAVLKEHLMKGHPGVRVSALSQGVIDSLSLASQLSEHQRAAAEERGRQIARMLREQEEQARRDTAAAANEAERMAAEERERAAARRREEMERRPADAANCLLHRSEWTVHWWGVRVCLDRECTTLLQTVLGSHGGGDRLRGAVEAGLAGGAAAATAFVARLATAAIAAIYLFVLSIAITLVSGPRGVCLNFNWIGLTFGFGALTVIPTPR